MLRSSLEVEVFACGSHDALRKLVKLRKLVALRRMLLLRAGTFPTEENKLEVVKVVCVCVCVFGE